MTDPLDALAAWHQRHADQARFDGDHGRAQIHQWADTPNPYRTTETA